MNRVLTILVIAILAVGVACSSGGGSGGGIVQSGLGAAFTPDEPTPGSDTVSASQGPVTGDVVTIDVLVTNTNNVYAAAFDLLYDSSMATYVGWSQGTLLEQGSNATSYDVDDTQVGRLVIGAQRVGSVNGADASGSVAVIRLSFRVTSVGNSVISFQSANLLDDQQFPQPISPLDWFGGVILGS